MSKLRKLSLSVHRYVGIVAGLILCVVAITGSLLVFEAELDRVFQPYQITPQAELQSHQVLIDTAQKLHPDLQPHRITMPAAPDRPYTVMMVDRQEQFTDVSIDPYSGKILESKPWKHTLGGWLIDLHVHLFTGDLGGQIVGLVGIALQIGRAHV